MRSTVPSRVITKCRAAVLAALFAAALSTAPTSSEAQSTLRWVPQADLRILDTTWTTAAITRNHGYLVYEPLFSYDSANVPRPQAVERYEASPDGLTWRFTLSRHGVPRRQPDHRGGRRRLARPLVAAQGLGRHHAGAHGRAGRH